MSLLAQLLFEADDELKRHALELQTALLDHPYGEHLNVELESSVWQDAFDKTNIAPKPETFDEPVIIVHVSDELSKNKVFAIVTKHTVYSPMLIDAISLYSLNIQDVSNEAYKAVINETIGRLLDHFIVSSSTGAVAPTSTIRTTFSATQVAKALGRDLIFMIDKTGECYQYKAAVVKFVDLKAGQCFICSTKTPRNLAIELNKVKAGGLSFNSSAEALAHYSSKYVKDLLLKRITVELKCRDLGTNQEILIIAKPHGTTHVLTVGGGSSTTLLALDKV